MLDGVLVWCMHEPLGAVALFVAVGILVGVLAGWRSHVIDPRHHPRC